MSISQGIRKACRIVVGWLCVLLLFLNSLSPLAQHAIDRHMGFWMLWGFYEILLLQGAVALVTPARASAKVLKWQARLRLLGGGVIILFGCLTVLLFQGEGLILCALFVSVGLWLFFTAVRTDARAQTKSVEIHDA